MIAAIVVILFSLPWFAERIGYAYGRSKAKGMVEATRDLFKTQEDDDES